MRQTTVKASGPKGYVYYTIDKDQTVRVVVKEGRKKPKIVLKTDNWTDAHRRYKNEEKRLHADLITLMETRGITEDRFPHLRKKKNIRSVKANAKKKKKK